VACDFALSYKVGDNGVANLLPASVSLVHCQLITSQFSTLYAHSTDPCSNITRCDVLNNHHHVTVLVSRDSAVITWRCIVLTASQSTTRRPVSFVTTVVSTLRLSRSVFTTSGKFVHNVDYYYAAGVLWRGLVDLSTENVARHLTPSKNSSYTSLSTV